jgi:hypothetical protein
MRTWDISESLASTRAKLRPLTKASVSPRYRNSVPIVTTSAGMPMRVTKTPFSSPASAPTASAVRTASATLPVVRSTAMNPTMPRPMIEGNDRSMSPLTMTIVSRRAGSAKHGVVCANEM